MQEAVLALLVARTKITSLYFEADEQTGQPVTERQALLDVHVE